MWNAIIFHFFDTKKMKGEKHFLLNILLNPNFKIFITLTTFIIYYLIKIMKSYESFF
jgi:hypothetical protein